MTDTTEQQRAFVGNYVANGGNGVSAALAAGYSARSAKEIAHRLIRKPHVARAIREEQMVAIGGRLCSTALATLEAIMTDPKAPAGARVDAAKTLLDRGGLCAISANSLARGAVSDTLAEMTAEELRAFIAQGRATLAAYEAEEAGERAAARPALEHQDHIEH